MYILFIHLKNNIVNIYDVEALYWSMSICYFFMPLQDKQDVHDYSAKHIEVTPPIFDDIEHSPCNLKKKPKQDWSCNLCQITATSEK